MSVEGFSRCEGVGRGANDMTYFGFGPCGDDLPEPFYEPIFVVRRFTDRLRVGEKAKVLVQGFFDEV